MSKADWNRAHFFKESSMHEQDVNTGTFNPQANNAVDATRVNGVQQFAHDIENSATDAVILIDAVFDVLDTMHSVPEELQRAMSAINCFATCAKRHVTLITEANCKLLDLELNVVPQ
jgi:hypothetical protein